MNDLSTVNARLEMLSELALDYAVLLMCVSILTVALLELLKAVFSMRRRFHSRRLAELFSAEPGLVAKVVEIAAAGDRKALCEQRTEAFISRLQEVAQIVVRNAESHADLFRFLTKRTELPAEPDATRSDAENRRILRPVKVRLDAFSLSMVSTWAWRNQVCAVNSAACLLFYALGGELNCEAEMFPRAAASILGGMASPFAKDLVIALAGLRWRVMGGPLGGP